MPHMSDDGNDRPVLLARAAGAQRRLDVGGVNNGPTGHTGTKKEVGRRPGCSKMLPGYLLSAP